mgnify:CR=1 FL=1
MLSLEAIRAIRDLAGALVVTIPISMLIYALHNRYGGGKHVYRPAQPIEPLSDEDIDRKLDEIVAKYGTWEWPPRPVVNVKKPKREVKPKPKAGAGSNPAQIITPVGKGEHGWIVRIDRRGLNAEKK